MTNREKITQYLASQGIDLGRRPYVEEKDRYQRPGTIVIKDHYLNYHERQWLWTRWECDCCPIEIHGIRDHFEWQEGLIRITWKKHTT